MDVAKCELGRCKRQNFETPVVLDAERRTPNQVLQEAKASVTGGSMASLLGGNLTGYTKNWSLADTSSKVNASNHVQTLGTLVPLDDWASIFPIFCLNALPRRLFDAAPGVFDANSQAWDWAVSVALGIDVDLET